MLRWSHRCPPESSCKHQVYQVSLDRSNYLKRPRDLTISAAVLYLFGHIQLLAFAYTAVSPTFQYEKVPLGGFGFSDQQIALIIMDAGASQALWILLVFPILQKRLSTGAVLRGTSIVWPFFMVMYPVLNEFLRHGWRTAFWAIFPAGVALGSGVSMAFGKLGSLSPSQDDVLMK